MGLIDSHAHLTFPELRDRVDAVLTRCDEAGVDRVITVGIDLNDGRDAVELAERHPGRIHGAAAFHPHEAEKTTDSDLTAMARLWDHPAIVALGEMGLDYHYEFAARDAQCRVFARQLELASSRSKPLIIHCREAFDDVIGLLADRGFEGHRVVFHCFTGTRDEASRVLDFGWCLSFTGIVTFRASTSLHSVAKRLPKDAVMIETDSPYLSPVPLRGQRPNEPANVTHIARFLAELRGASLDELIQQTSYNTRQFFGL